MNRIDRLTAMILMLQGRRVVTADQIAEHFEISVRTVYRDLTALSEAGVPIVAEAGVGYSLMPGYHMPPVMFTEQEAAALFMSGELGAKFGDDSLKQALDDALLKIRAALPQERRDYLSRLGNAVGIAVPPRGLDEEHSMMTVQEAVVRRHCLELSYDAGSRGELTTRTVESLGVVFYDRHWHLIAWCRLRQAIRDFRLDRIRECKVLEETFDGHEGFSVADFLQQELDEHALIPVTLECERWALDWILTDLPGRIVERSGGPGNRVRVEALAFSLEWLAGWLLSLGTAVHVVTPEKLRHEIVSAAQAVMDQHQVS